MGTPVAAQLVAPASSYVMENPATPTGTRPVVLIREQGGGSFVSIDKPYSLTLRELTEEFSITSVVECDSNGRVEPRAVAIDSPSDILHCGKHYIARRDAARVEKGGSRVIFRGKIVVKEYAVEHSTPLSSQPMGGSSSSITSCVSSSSDVKRQCNGLSPCSTSRTSIPHDGYLVSDGKENRPLMPPPICRGLPESHERKRHRVHEINSQDGCEGLLSDGHLSSCTTTGAHPMRFIPFAAILPGDEKETLITLEVLTALCGDVTNQESVFERRHQEAEDVLECARRVLFSDS